VRDSVDDQSDAEEVVVVSDRRRKIGTQAGDRGRV
jgi:hypothetical protein